MCAPATRRCWRSSLPEHLQAVSTADRASDEIHIPDPPLKVRERADACRWELRHRQPDRIAKEAIRIDEDRLDCHASARRVRRFANEACMSQGERAARGRIGLTIGVDFGEGTVMLLTDAEILGLAHLIA